MNKRLQAILNLIQQSESLTPEEKKSLADAVNESDKERTITEFKLERTEKVKRTTAILLEQTIAELEQKRKSVEAQNRELEIEASLERVRARTMGMQKSEELKEIIQVVYDQFRHLNILIEHAGFIIDYKARNDMNIWLADPHEVPTQVTIPYFDSPHWNSFNEAKEKGLDFFANHLSFEEKNRFYNGLFNVFPGVSDEAKEYYFGCPGLAISTVLLENVGLYIENFSGIPYSNDENDILIRFGKVFQQTYTRFLDLQKAEAQAREAQIETSLEKVRSRSLAMYHSDELEQVVASLFDRLVELGLSFDGALIFIFDKEKRDICLWIATNHLSAPVKIDLPYDEDIKNNAIIKDLWNAIDSGEHIFNRSYSGETKNDYFRYVSKYNESKIPESVRKIQIEADSWTAYFAAEKNSIIGFDSWSGHIITTEDFQTLIRFARVFEQTYTRFLDLQKAESQARESQIQLALERVRARTMAMHKSEELAETAHVLFQQLIELGGFPDRISIGIAEEPNGVVNFWTTDQQGSHLNQSFSARLNERTTIAKTYQAWKEQKKSLVVDLHGEELKEWIQFAREEMGIAVKSDQIKDRRVHSLAFFSHGWILVTSHEPQSADTIQILERFASVFNLTYRRFLDLQKAETQAREAQIEAALERVRSRTMAMQHSSELGETSFLLAKQVGALGIQTWGCAFSIFDEDQKTSTEWFSNEKGYLPTYKTPREGVFLRYYEAAQRGESLHVEEFEGEKCVAHYKYLSTLPVLGDILKKYSESGVSIPTFQIDHVAYFKYGYLLFVTYQPMVEAHDIFKRFAKVFEQTYTRFLDLQKAEEQAREAQIEAALERVRSKTMAMHNSQDVGDTVVTMFNELVKLGVKTNRCGVLIHSDPAFTEVWTAKANQDEKATLIVGHLDTSTHPMLSGVRNSWMNKESSFTYELAGEDIKNYYKVINDSKDYRYRVDIDALPSKEIHSDFHFREGSIFAFTAEPIDEEALRIFSRFAGVFGQTYTRFLDLQKAEAQTREAQIEAALERIRSRALAMHTSGDLIDVANVLRDQMGLLGQPELESSIVHLYHDNSTTFEAWYAYRPPNRSNENIITGTVTVDRDCSEWSREALEKYASSDSEYTIISTGKKINEWYKVLEVIAPAVVEYDHHGQLIVPEILYYHLSKFSGGALLMISNQQPSAEVRELQRRAAVVFGLAVTRFLDLKRAEEQAREAKIEASLERVRGKAMAMHSSEDLAATIGIFYRELESFSITPRRCGVGLLDEETRMAEVSTMNTTEQGDSVEIIGKLKMEGHPVLEGIFDNWILQCEYHPVLRGNEIKEYYQLMRPQISFPEYPNDAVQFGYFFYFTEGGVYAWTEKELAEDELKIYRKFTSVLSLTYKRYKDLKDAEIRAKEAVKQATIDRVRAEIASMRTKQDLDRITPLIWNELTILGIPFVRCGVFIMDDRHQLIHTFLSTPDGKAIGAFQLNYEVSNLREAIRHWHDKQVYVTHWGEKEFGEMAGTLLKQGSIMSLDQYLNTLPTGGIHLHFLPFLQGMLYVGNTAALQQDDIHLLQSLADAFSTAYARYEDFNKLEAAKQQVDQALIELKQTQQQLVQSEKMASLGELTAGIAHEIQNPLNFVNNFSEVSNELIDEMVDEVKKGNFDEAKVIANDIKQNLEKINHHGKRADGIVKSMLQHSRSSGSQKELIDINVLCDEYLRLSYHGLRAKDKSFNARFETNFDSTLEKISVIPQDIGRVILNLINNAFYAVTEKRKANLVGYEPIVSIGTIRHNGKVEITVKDNGIGIPQKVIDKIFQPFFTTKPTGQGTGLGLSLSYDIVKAHGGELKVETQESEGSKFIIQLPG